MKSLACMMTAILLLSATSALAREKSCDEQRREAASIAKKQAAEATRIARLPETLEAWRQARALFGALPQDLLKAGSENFTAQLSFDAIDTAREGIKQLRMSLPQGECSWSEAFARRAREEQVVAQERKLDELDWRADARLQHARATLDAMAADFVASHRGYFSWERGLAYDDRARELRICLPYRARAMASMRFCARFDLGRQRVEYGVHMLATSPNEDLVQSDQAMLLDLGTVAPDELVKTPAGREKLLGVFVEDASFLVRSDCRQPAK